MWLLSESCERGCWQSVVVVREWLLLESGFVRVWLLSERAVSVVVVAEWFVRGFVMVLCQSVVVVSREWLLFQSQRVVVLSECGCCQ